MSVRDPRLLVALVGLAVSLAGCGRLGYGLGTHGDGGPRIDASDGFRAYYYVPSSVVIDGSISLVALAEDRRPYDGAHLRVAAGSIELEMEVAGVVGSGAATVPRDRWVCVELHVAVDDATGLLEAHVDGALVARAEPVDTRPERGITLAEVGIHDADIAQGPALLFVDEVVVDTSRVGCD